MCCIYGIPQKVPWPHEYSPPNSKNPEVARLFEDSRWQEVLTHLDRNMQAPTPQSLPLLKGADLVARWRLWGSPSGHEGRVCSLRAQGSFNRPRRPTSYPSPPGTELPEPTLDGCPLVLCYTGPAAASQPSDIFRVLLGEAFC